MCVKQDDMFEIVHGSIVPNTLKRETTQISINRYIYSDTMGIYITKKRHTQHWLYIVEWKKQDMEDDRQYDSIHIKFKTR